MFAVVLHTEKMPGTPGGPIQGQISYKMFADTGAKGKQNPEILSAALLPGMNLGVTPEDIEVIKKSQQGARHLAAGVIEIIAPEKSGEGLSIDFPEVVALRLIAETYDQEWIDRSTIEETRIPIKNALRERKKAIDDELEMLGQQAQTTVLR